MSKDSEMKKQLEQELEELKNEVNLIKGSLDYKYFEIRSKYRNNIFALRKYIHSISDIDEKRLYVKYYERILSEYGSWIGITARFQSKPCFPHGYYGIFISGSARIGADAVIFQHVTIGSNTIKGSLRWGSPQIGNNVYIGAGAKVIGRIKIGNNVRIGANCIVTSDIPDNSVVVMQKPRIIHKDMMDNRFFRTIDRQLYFYKNGKYHLYDNEDKVF